jgi:D-sedoheptulose 7-phosphate isomerase
MADRERVVSAFFEDERDELARACRAMARAFARGGVLIPFGTGAAASDAAHVTVEFMHPVIVGKRALPALAPSNDITGASTLGRLAGPFDIALALAHGPGDEAVDDFLGQARARGLLTLAMLGAGGAISADHAFVVPSDDPDVVQEVQETAYHVLWELVHVFFEHPGLLEDACVTCGDVAVEARVVRVRDGIATVEGDGKREEVAVDLVGEVEAGDALLCHAGVALERLEKADTDRRDQDPTGFLYPFLAHEEADLDRVLDDVGASTARKAEDVVELRRKIDLAAIECCAADLSDRLRSGGRVIAFGNGGSATDAQDVVADCLARGHPAIALGNDAATVTAVGNDVGFDRVFARQLIALGRREDVALAISTSGSSSNILVGLEEAHRRGMLTCAIAGYDGGRLRELEWLNHLFIAPSDYIPRIQEAHATIYHLLLEAVGRAG